MADLVEKNAIHTKDGRRGEELLYEDDPCQGEGVRQRKVFVEPKIEKRLSKVVTEHTRPSVYKRIVDTYDEETGEVVEQKIESVNDVELKLVSHVTAAASVTAQQHEVDDCDCNVTREEFKEGLVMAVQAAVSAAVDSLDDYETEVEEPVRHAPVQAFVAEKVEQTQNKIAMGNLVLLGIIAAQVAGLCYIMFWM